MVRRRNKALALMRDALVSFFSVVVLSTSWGQWVRDPVFYVVDSLAVVFLVLSAIDVALLARKVKWRGFYFGNAVYQLFPSFILTGLLGIFGAAVFVLNVAVLVTLREKRPEPSRQPPTHAAT